MQVGVKYYSHNKIERKDFEFADFVEVLPVPGNITGVFGQQKFKYTIHCAHDAFGFNPSNAKAHEKSRAIVNDAINAADQLGAKVIVVHAGFNTPALKIKEPKKNAIKFLQKHFDKRMHIENLLPVDGEMTWVAYSPDEIAEFQDLGFKFCLDFGHAVATAAHFGKDYREYVDQFAGLKPDYFHLSGTFKGVDKHRSIFDTDADVDFFKSIIKKAGKPVCLETPLDSEQRKKEVEFLKKRS